MMSVVREKTYWQAVRLFVVALTLMMLAACAQPSAVTPKSASLASGRYAPFELNRKEAVATHWRVAVAVAKHGPFASDKPAGQTHALSGLASFYAEGSETANGERFDAHELTAAHPTLPFGTRVRVTHVGSGRSVTVRINDRGPFISGRVIDVSYSAAEALGMVGRGVTKVKLDVVQ